MEACEALAKAGKIVIVAGLDANYRREPFGKLIDLVPVAEKVKKLSAICRDCCETASFTVRIGGSGGREVNMVGGEEMYKPVCRKCYY